MPIEFLCSHCGRKLRTPDGSQGKRAVCPNCRQVVEVPLADAAEADPKLSAYDPAPQTSPPAGTAPAANPYQAPSSETTWSEPSLGEQLGIQGELTLGWVFSEAWKLVRGRWVDSIMLSLALVGLYVLMIIVSGVVQNKMSGGRAAIAVGMLVNMAVQVFVTVIGMVLAMNFAADRIAGERGTENLLRNAGRWPRLLGLNIMITLVMFGIAMVFGLLFALVLGTLGANNAVSIALAIALYIGMLVAIYAAMMAFLVSPWLVLHHNAGVMESLRLSSTYMRGKRLRSFWIIFAMSLICGLLLLITLGLGVLVIPALACLAWGLICALVIRAPRDAVGPLASARPAG
jgi:hypothetical protein